MTIEEILIQHFSRKKGKIKNKSGRDTSQKYYTDVYREILDELIDLKIVIKKVDFKKFVEDNLPIPKKGSDYSLEFETCDSPKDWVFKFFERQNINIIFDVNNPGKRINTQQDMSSDVKEWEKYAMNDLHAYNSESYQWDEVDSKRVAIRNPFTKEQIKDTMEAQVPILDRERKPAMRDVLRFSEKRAEGATKLLRVFVKSMGTTRPDFDLKMIMHWMWQVKRYVYGYKVDDPLFLNLYSKQGTGKTTFLRGLYSPLGAYTWEPKMDAIKSEGHAKLWSTKYIIMFDEIRVDSSDKKDMYSLMSNIKYLLTMDMNMYRMFRTQDFAENPRTFSAISTSNQPLVESLYDKTGMRRFYEIVCEASADDKTFLKLPFINADDPEKAKKAETIFKNAWRGIDETRKMGYLSPEDREELKDIQGTYKKLDCIEMHQMYSSDIEDPFITMDDTEDVEIITKLFSENKTLSKSKMEDLCIEKGYILKTIVKYMGDINNWAKEEKVDTHAYGVTRMPRELKAQGFFVEVHQGVPFLVIKADPGEGHF